jgi:excisionase family DNA binding protein
MRRSTYTESANGVADAQLSVDSSLANRGLPNRLMTAFEVAEYVGCHEETVRRAYLRGLLTSQRFGVRSRRFHPADVLDWIKRGAPTRIS